MAKKLLTFTLALTLALPVFAKTHLSMQVPGAEQRIEHSGGCRKDSPAGMCCHAGSQPYHCH